MSMFTLDHENVFEGGLQDGTYEVVVYLTKQDAAKSGTEFINLSMIVRNDIEQKGKNQYVFHKIWASKETGQFNTQAINTIGKALQLPNGKQYNSLDELLQDFTLKTCRVTVKNETSEFNGTTYNNLNVKKWETTKFPTFNHVFKTKDDSQSEAFSNPGKPIEISDDSLPF